MRVGFQATRQWCESLCERPVHRGTTNLDHDFLASRKYSDKKSKYPPTLRNYSCEVPTGTPMSNRLLRSLQRLTSPPAEEADADLLDRFTRLRDETAFEVIVRRHGGMVLSICRRRLGSPQDAEDAFQTVFLVLARDAGRIGSRESLPGWLYRVALLTSLKLMGRNARRRTAPLHDEGPALDSGQEADIERRELRAILDEELADLPDRLRAPVILCYVEGRSNGEAAALLGCPRGTIDSRLATARKRLLGRLLRRGVAPAAGMGGVESALRSDAVAAPVLSNLIEKTLQVALRSATVAGAACHDVLSLADEVTSAMSMKKLWFLTALTVTLTLVGGGLGLYYAAADGKSPPPAATKDDAKTAKTEPKSAAPIEAKKPTVVARPELKLLTSAEVQSRLRDRIKLPHLDEGIPLKELLEFLTDTYHVPIRIDSAAFTRMRLNGANKFYDEMIKLPVTRGMNFGDVLREALSQLNSGILVVDGNDVVLPVTYRI